MNLEVRIVQWTKETQSLYMVHVKMCKKHVNPAGFRRNLTSQLANSGAGVEGQDRAIASSYLDC